MTGARIRPPTLTVSPRLYRWHLNDQEVLPTLLGRATQLLTDDVTVRAILEGERPFLVLETDSDLQHPAQTPLGGPLADRLTGCALTALLALRLMVERTERAGEAG